MIGFGSCGNAAFSKQVKAATHTLLEAQILQQVTQVGEPDSRIRRPAQDSLKDFVYRHTNTLPTTRARRVHHAGVPKLPILGRGNKTFGGRGRLFLWPD